ncbi:All-trans-zeta-carotene desaturase [Rosistilla carotiformis]|uniref:All-trans-zeta-carotene desaturase n=1 Tax=Rosistilla carotiformis TaxID=2528017 RepID=A0A518JTX5_9BACT|nr:All-trans-zeta-carotene desaturase [Rosistilla carotiformis]
MEAGSAGRRGPTGWQQELASNADENGKLSSAAALTRNFVKRNVVIIGAGPGGLATAMQLAAAGLNVTVVERRGQVGGRTSAIEADRFRFDLGPTFFLYPRVLREIFASVGRDLDTEVPMRRLETQYRLTFGQGGQLDASNDLEAMDRQIRQFAPEDAGKLKKYLDDNRVKLARFRPILESPFSSPLDLLRPDVLKAFPLLHPLTSLGSELERYFSDPRMVIALSFQAKYLGMSPFRCPSLFSILSFLEYEYGVHHPIGGCAAVSERMAEIAQAMGVQIRLNQPVTGLQFSGRRVTGVQTATESIAADAIVINADFAAAMRDLVPNTLRRRWADKKLAGKKYSCSTFMMYLGVRGEIDGLAHHNIHIARDYQQNLRDIEIDHRLSDDPSFYVQNPGVTDPTLAPEGHRSLYVLVPVSHEHPNIDWAKETPRFRELTLDRLSQIGLPDLRDRIVYEKIVTPADWSGEHKIYRGATFNLAHNLGQMLHRRPQNRFEELDGVYLVGGGTHPGSGLPVIYESSRISSRLLLNDLGIDTSFIDAAAATSN